MNRNPHIFVIIPVYNCENLLNDAVSSVLNQPYKQISIVLVNDGSKDGSPELCNTLSQIHANIHVIHQENQGVSVARNTGIEYVLSLDHNENDYIAFLDADDLWAKNCLTDDILTVSLHDIICFCSCEVSFDLKKCRLHTMADFGQIVRGGNASIWRYYFHFGAFLYRISLCKKYNIRFDSALKYDEDLVFLMQQIYLSDTIREIPKMLYLYRQNPNSAMSKRPTGVDYYIPKIKGWLLSDKKMCVYANEHRGILNGGIIHARSFILKMAQEHYMQFGSKRKLYAALENLEVYQDFIDFQPRPERIHRFKEHLFFKEHPNLFMFKYYFKGFGVLIYKKFLRHLIRRSFKTPNTFLD